MTTARRATSRAFTLLEVILAVIMLAAVTTSIVAVIAYIERSDSRDRARLAAHEVANRLVLQWLSDADRIPSPSLPISYGDRYQFFFELSVTPVVMDLNEEQLRGETTLQGLDRYRIVSVRVFAADESDPRRPVPSASELALVWRVYDPAAPRNPDQITELGSDPERIRRLLDEVLNGFAPSGRAIAGGGRSPLEREGGRLR